MGQCVPLIFLAPGGESESFGESLGVVIIKIGKYPLRRSSVWIYQVREPFQSMLG
jgi:hypothetical protein